MGEKQLLGILLLVAAGMAGVVLACLSRRMRQLFFVLLIVLAPLSAYMEVNFLSREWYRGTTRGLEFCGLDVLSLSLLIGTFLFPRHGGKRFFWPASLGLMLAFLLFAVACVMFADPKLFGTFALLKMARGVLVFLAVALFVRGPRELRLAVLAFGFIVSLEGLVALFQRYGQGIDRVIGTLEDSNSLSMYFCTTAPLLVAAINARIPKVLKLLSALAVALASVGVILTISRTGVVAMAAVLVGCTLATISFQITPRRFMSALIILLASVGIAAKSWNTVKARFDQSSLKEEYKDKHSQGRGFYIRVALAIAQDRWFGVGPNNWSYWVSNRYGRDLGWTYVPYRGTDKEPSEIVPPGGNVDQAQAAPAHNLAALILGEMGVVGLLIFLLLWLRWFQMGAGFLWPRSPDPQIRLGAGLFFCVAGIFLQSITEWVFYQDQIFVTFHVLLGMLAALYYRKNRAKVAMDAAANAPPSPAALARSIA